MTAHIQIVGWNHRDYLEACLRSCLAQTTRLPVLYVDNASEDGSAAFVRSSFPEVRVHVNATNRGYSGGHNDGLRLILDTDVVIVLNPDVVLDPEFAARGLKAFTHARIGAVAPLLLRPRLGLKDLLHNNPCDGHDGFPAANTLIARLSTSSSRSRGRRMHRIRLLALRGFRSKNHHFVTKNYHTRGLKDSAPEESAAREIVDACGTVLLKSLRAVNQGEGQALPVAPVSEARVSPWGFSGAAAFLRRAALEDVAQEGAVFDEDLFSYREDVDLSWRLRLRGWDIVGAPGSRAVHTRTAKAKERKPPRVAELSWRNYFLVLAKDVPALLLFRSALYISGEALGRLIVLAVSFSLWPALPELVRLLPRFLKKRKAVLGSSHSLARTYLTFGLHSLPRFADGRFDFSASSVAPVLNAIVRRGDALLLLKRSAAVGTYPGVWHTVAGYLDEPWKTSEEKALQEIEEETGIARTRAVVRRVGTPLTLKDARLRKTWLLHPVLVDVPLDARVELDWEHTEFRWILPRELAAFHTVPGLAHAVRRLAPHRP